MIGNDEDSKALRMATDFSSRWAEMWELPLATEKTHFILIGPKV